MSRRKIVGSVVVVVAAVVGLLVITWPSLGSKVTMLTPPENELHHYMKTALRAENDLIIDYRALEQHPDDRDQVGDVLKQAEKLQKINKAYWEDGMRPSIFRRVMNRLSGTQPPPAFLPTWPGPDTGAGKAAMADMRMDTATLAVKAWRMREAADVLTKAVASEYGDGGAATKAALAAVNPSLTDARETRAYANEVYKRWKGNYRPPLSILR